ncbi:MAG TPA: UDP-3-O-acyl-N-acetylglucosamine deacetylase [Pirellulales bacterium]|jgi:UDP-3-O-acyl N-acetylglucosamine deacetylase|nr:UDP-3-O-acyl-N-acetylglucosamine deacetylase [Pirellulales bacterium]
MLNRFTDDARRSLHAPRRQQTIARPAVVEGFGYWSGKDVRVEFKPAAADAGVSFVRGDLARPVRIRASVANRVEAPRRTTLRSGGASVEMVEHIMAALGGLGVDNCEVWVSASEMPGLDGSSLPYVDALTAAGLVELNAVRPALFVREVTRLGNEESWVEARPGTSGGLTLKFHLDYGPGNAIGRQTLSLPVTSDSFRRELAPSRTFMLKAEADWLLAQGLGRRASLKDLLVFDAEGPIDNELRFRDECVRHKALDLVGDLSLAGCDLVTHIIAYRSGHRLNAELVRVLLTEGDMVGGFKRSA